MANPKKWGDQPECDFNEYDDTARAEALEPTGWTWSYQGPVAGAPKPPNIAPAPKPLAKAALKKLQAQAEQNAKDQAKSDIAKISAYDCPSSCKRKIDLDSNLFDEPYCVGKPQPRLDWVPDIRYFGPFGIPTVIIFRFQVWAQKAEQKYHVHFRCETPPRKARA